MYRLDIHVDIDMDIDIHGDIDLDTCTEEYTYIYICMYICIYLIHMYIEAELQSVVAVRPCRTGLTRHRQRLDSWVLQATAMQARDFILCPHHFAVIQRRSSMGQPLIGILVCSIYIF